MARHTASTAKRCSCRQENSTSNSAADPSITFSELKSLLDTTDGNLSVHARKLEDADYIKCTKSFEGRVPRTSFSMTAIGQRALERYLNHMEAVIQATRER